MKKNGGEGKTWTCHGLKQLVVVQTCDGGSKRVLRFMLQRWHLIIIADLESKKRKERTKAHLCTQQHLSSFGPQMSFQQWLIVIPNIKKALGLFTVAIFDFIFNLIFKK